MNLVRIAHTICGRNLLLHLREACGHVHVIPASPDRCWLQVCEPDDDQASLDERLNNTTESNRIPERSRRAIRREPVDGLGPFPAASARDQSS